MRGLTGLLLLRLLAAADQMPPVYLNHIYVRVPSETIEAITTSEFLRETFSGFDVTTTKTRVSGLIIPAHLRCGMRGKGSTKRPGRPQIEQRSQEIGSPFQPVGRRNSRRNRHRRRDRFSTAKWWGDGSTYTGAYVHGKRTAIEILPIDAKSRRLGIALSVDHVNELAAVARRFVEKTGVHPQIRHMTRNIAGRVVPWFDYIVLNPPAPDRLLVTWIMAHDPSYPRERYPDLKPEENGTTREQYQARKYRPDKLFADITGASFVVPANVIQSTITDLAAFGWAVRKHRKQRVALGPEAELTFIPAQTPSQYRITLQLRLNRPKRGQPIYKLGDSELRFGSGPTAVWTFSVRRQK